MMRLMVVSPVPAASAAIPTAPSAATAANPVTQKTQLVIVGSGPAGYTAGIYSARAGLAPTIIAGSITAGGSLMNTTEVENFPGFPEGVMGPDLMSKLQAQAEKFGAHVVFDDVTKAELTGVEKVLTTALGDTYEAEAVILATGSEYRKLHVPGEAELAGKGVSYCATCDGFFFRDQQIMVVGGGDSAMEEATFLTRFASQVTVVHRRDSLRASEIVAQRAQHNPKINFVWDSVVEKINGTDKVSSVTVKNVKTGAIADIPVTGVFIAIGSDPVSGLFSEQLDLHHEGYIKVDGRTSETSIRGVFAAGDVIDHKYRQAVTAAASGCVAALDAQHYLTELAEQKKPA